MPSIGTYSNVDYSAQIWRTGSQTNLANSIIIRASGGVDSNGDYNNYYAFQLAKNGTFGVWKRVNGAFTTLKTWTSSGIINQGSAWNELRVWASGSNFWFYINGTLLWSGSDSSLSSGRVGVRTYRSSTSTNDGFWVDSASLDVLGADAADPADEVNVEQAALNATADEAGAGNPEQAP